MARLWESLRETVFCFIEDERGTMRVEATDVYLEIKAPMIYGKTFLAPEQRSS
jgi:hypothetical protein